MALDVVGIVLAKEVGLLLRAGQDIGMGDEVAVERRRPALVGADDEERRSHVRATHVQCVPRTPA
jgi:hypothetical protein